MQLILGMTYLNKTMQLTTRATIDKKLQHNDFH